MVRSARLNPRARLRDAESRASSAAAAERESTLIGQVACVLLADSGSGAEPATLARIDDALAAAGLRLELKHAPCPAAGESALPVKLRTGSGWLYVNREGDLQRSDAERIAGRLAELLNQAHDRAAIADSDSEAARRAEVGKSAMLHAISNDLRGPLTAITTAAGDLTAAELDDEDRQRLTQVVCSEADELARMVADLADLSRIGAGAVNPQPEPCNLGETVQRAAEHVRARRGDHEIRLTLPLDLPPVRADRAQIERAFANLIDNAIKFSPPAAPIEIRAVAANGRVTIRVVDHGRGVAPGHQSQVFEPFVRGGNAGPGQGLGLAICRGFVEANGGRIMLQSRARDGSAFAVSFPVAAKSSVHVR